MKFAFVTALLALCCASICHGRATIELKNVQFDLFMQHAIAESVSVPLSIPVPKDYENVSPKGTPAGYSYWMRPEDVKEVERTADLPSGNGYMSGHVSLDVGYDKSRDVFIGAEDRATIDQMKKLFGDFKMSRFRSGGHPVLVMSMRAKQTGKLIYAMYVATGLDTNVVFISFRPPENSSEIGDYVWQALKHNLAGPN